MYKPRSRSRAALARALLFPLLALSALAFGTGALASLSGRAPDDQSAASTQADFVRVVQLQANDVIYNPADQTLYASVPSAAGAAGNSVVPVNPLNGQIGAAVFVGSEPNRLALSDDGHTLYVGLDGAFAVRRFDTQTRAAGVQFSLGQESFFGPYTPHDMAVAPGNPNVVAVARYYSGVSPPEAGVAIYDNGAVRAKTGAGHIAGSDYVAYSASEPKLYGGGDNGGLRTMTIDATGVASTTTASQSVGSRIKLDGGLVYGSAGKVMNPDTGALVGSFSGAFSAAFVPDSSVGRVYYLTGGTFNGTLTLRAYDINTFVPVGTATISGVTGNPTTLVRWGSNGLAFRTDTRQLCIIQTSLIPSADPVPTPTPTPTATPTPTPTPAPPTLVRRVDLQANDLVISPSDQQLYVSVPSTGGANVGNTITSVDPAAATLGASTFVGSEPGRLALSDDGHTLYVYLNGSKAARRFDTQTRTPGLQFTVGTDSPYDMEVVPGSPGSLVVSRGTTFNNGLAIYDDGVQRPNAGSGSAYGIGPIEFGASPSVLYGYDSFSSGFELVKFKVDSSGITQVYSTGNLITGYLNALKFSGGRLYSGSGRVVDPEARAVVGTFPGGGTALTVDAASGRAFYITTDPGSTGARLSAYDINTFMPLGSVALPGVVGAAGSLVRWGSNGLAFCTVKQPFDASATSAVYLIQSALVSDAQPIPSAFQFSAAAYGVNESASQNNSVTITVTRTGGTTGTATVNYATGGGTATPGVDYTAVSGTLTFGDGETSKTFAVPILDDNFYEGNETVGLTLGSPSSGALLGVQPTATLTILDNEFRPSVSPVGVSVPEGDSGNTQVDLTVRLTNATTQTVTVNYKTTDGTATAPADYAAASGTLTYAPGETVKTIPLQIVGEKLDESNENFFVDFSGATNADAFQRGQVTILDDDHPTVQFSTASFSANEGDGRAQITVKRTGNTDAAATVNYLTQDDPRAVRCDDNVNSAGVAFARCDYATVVGTLTFAPGETQKTFTVPVIDDGYAEPAEFLRLQLSAPAGATLGTQSLATLTIFDNDAANQPNPIFNTDFFVRQQYLDFLSREPEAGQPWSGVINNCAAGDTSCDRVSVSANFFRSQEFQLKGLFVFRFYKVAFNRMPRYTEVVADMAAVTGSTTAELIAKKAAYTTAFGQRSEFTNAFGAMTNQTFVDTLMNRYNLQSITTINPASPDDSQAPRVTLARSDLVSQLTAGTLTRGQVVRAIADSNEVSSAEFNPAFVAMQYFGYLRRDPEPGGYNAWLQTINANPSDFRSMVNGFMNSTEYRLRFGQP